jgi:hypothetical protein
MRQGLFLCPIYETRLKVGWRLVPYFCGDLRQCRHESAATASPATMPKRSCGISRFPAEARSQQSSGSTPVVPSRFWSSVDFVIAKH